MWETRSIILTEGVQLCMYLRGLQYLNILWWFYLFFEIGFIFVTKTFFDEGIIFLKQHISVLLTLVLLFEHTFRQVHLNCSKGIINENCTRVISLCLTILSKDYNWELLLPYIVTKTSKIFSQINKLQNGFLDLTECRTWRGIFASMWGEEIPSLFWRCPCYSTIVQRVFTRISTLFHLVAILIKFLN